MGGLYSPGALLLPSSSGHRDFLIQELTVDSSGLNILQIAKLLPQGQMLGCYERSQLHSQRPTAVPATTTPVSEEATFITLGRGSESSGPELKNVSSYFEQHSGNLAAQDF